jgi:hypothetical protein
MLTIIGVPSWLDPAVRACRRAAGPLIDLDQIGGNNSSE